MNEEKRTYRIDFWYKDREKKMHTLGFKFRLTRGQHECIKYYDEYGIWAGYDPYLLRDEYMSRYQRRRLDGYFGRREQAIMHAG